MYVSSGGCVGFRYAQSFGTMRPSFRVAPTLAFYLLVDLLVYVVPWVNVCFLSYCVCFFIIMVVLHDLVYFSMSLTCQVCPPFWVKRSRDQSVGLRKGSLCSVLVSPVLVFSAVRTHTPDRTVGAVIRRYILIWSVSISSVNASSTLQASWCFLCVQLRRVSCRYLHPNYTVCTTSSACTTQASVKTAVYLDAIILPIALHQQTVTMCK